MKTKIFFRSNNPKKRNAQAVEKQGEWMFKTLDWHGKIRAHIGFQNIAQGLELLNFHSIFRKSAQLFFGEWNIYFNT